MVRANISLSKMKDAAIAARECVAAFPRSCDAHLSLATLYAAAHPQSAEVSKR